MEFTLVNKMTLLFAKRNSGKSVLLKHLVEEEKDQFNKVFVICPTEPINHFYVDSGITSKEFVFHEYSEKFIEKLMEKLAKENEGKPKEAHMKVLLILDDCIADVKFHTSPTLKQLFARGRHLSISAVLTSQNLKSISPLQRNNSDFILCGQINNHSFDILCEEFLSGDISKPDFKKWYQEATKDYGFAIINNNSVKSMDLDEMYGSIRVPSEMV